jgi:hypothetical protein
MSFEIPGAIGLHTTSIKSFSHRRVCCSRVRTRCGAHTALSANLPRSQPYVTPPKPTYSTTTQAFFPQVFVKGLAGYRKASERKTAARACQTLCQIRLCSIREVSLRPISPFSYIKVTHMHISVQTRAVGHEEVISYPKRRDIITGNARYPSASDNAS